MLPGGTGWPKFNQLEMVMQFRVIAVTDPHTQTNPQTGPITLHCKAKCAV